MQEDKNNNYVSISTEKNSFAKISNHMINMDKECKPSEYPKTLHKPGTKKEIFVLIPMAIPGTGKTLFVDTLNEILTNLDIAFDSISSNQIRKDLMDEFMDDKKISHTVKNKQIAFGETTKKQDSKFFSELKLKFQNLVEKFDRSLLYIDKNHPPNALLRTFDTIDEAMREIFLSSHDLNVIYVSLFPDCAFPMKLSINLQVPFSLSYFLQCYARIKHRTNHPTLNGDNKQLICILGMFVNNFMNFQLNKENFMNKENYMNIQLEEDKLMMKFQHKIKLPFTKEFSEEKIDKTLIKSAKRFLRNILHNKPVYNQRAERLVNLINKYYESPENFVSTRELVKSTAVSMIKKLFSISVYNTEEDETSRKVINDSLTLRSFPSKFMDVELEISEQSDKMISQVFMQAVLSFVKLDSYTYELKQMYKTLANNCTLPKPSWKFPNKDKKIWKSFLKINKSVASCTAYEKIKTKLEGEPLSIKAVVYIPGKLVTCYIDTPAYVENEFPYITLALCGTCSDRKSHDVLKALFSKSCVLEKDFEEILKPKDNTEKYSRKVEIKLDGMNVKCFVFKINPEVKFVAKMFWH